MAELRLEVLDEGEIDKIHRRSLDVLETVGFRVLDEEWRQHMARAGARVEEHSATVHMPRQLVEEALRQAPSIVELHRQDGKIVRVGGEHRMYSSLVIDPWIIDYQTQKPRRPVMDDVVRHTRLGNAHPTIDAIHRMDMPPADVPQEVAYIKTLEAFATNATKHLIARPSSLESLQDWVEVAEILADGRSLAEHPIITFGAAITTPLTLTGLNASILKTAVKKGVPVLPTISSMAGSTTPLSFAGTLLSANAETVFFVALTQLLNPGTPVICWSGQSVTDMRTGRDVYYGGDKMLWQIATGQMARFYGLPVRSECGGTIVGRYDVQSGMENALLMLGAIGGSAHWMGGLGSCYNAVGMSAEMIVIQADLAQLLERIRAGIDTSDDMMAYNAIVEVGPGGNFLLDPLTLQNLRSSEFFAGEVFDRLGEASLNDVKDSMLVRAHERVEALLATHGPTVPERIIEGIQQWSTQRLKKFS